MKEEAKYLEERQRIFDALKKTRGNKGKAAELLGISKGKLYNEFKRLKITNDEIKKELSKGSSSSLRSEFDETGDRDKNSSL